MTDHSVFVIDDDQAMRDSLLMLLQGEGIRARGFASAMQFLEQLPDDKSACVITDLRMPQIEGSELIQRLKALKGEGYRVILVNSNPATIMTDPSMADHIYLKPLTTNSIREILKKHKVDAVLPTMGGQTALNLCIETANASSVNK